jgi:hypothetical protein
MSVTVFDIFRLFVLIRLEKHYPGNIRAFMHHKFIKLQDAFLYFRQRKTGQWFSTVRLW